VKVPANRPGKEEKKKGSGAKEEKKEGGAKSRSRSQAE
jgi:hypothetical protein